MDLARKASVAPPKAPTSPTTLALAPSSPSPSSPKAQSRTPSTTTPRQSCDRCHKQKLRCTRENNGNGGVPVCDRCLRRRAQCVYSFSLPKGRPSLYRLANDSNASDPSGTENLPTSPACSNEHVKPLAVCRSTSTAASDTSTNMNIGANHAVVNPITNENFTWNGLMPIPMDIAMDPWPSLETLSWDDMQHEVDWKNYDSSYPDAALSPNLHNFGEDLSVQESAGSLYPPSPYYPYTHPQGQPRHGGVDKHMKCSGSIMDRSFGGGDGSTMNKSLEKYINCPSLVIAQLSQLSMRLSSLRYSSYTLAEAAESSSTHLPNGRQIPLIDVAAFESVASWLAYGQDLARMKQHTSGHASSESRYPSPAPETRPRDDTGILHEVFSASHHLLEIIEPFNASTTTFASSSATSDQRSDYFGNINGLGSSTGFPDHRNNTIHIIRHLVMACETLLLEIYVAVLIALQHDTIPGSSSDTMALGNIRLVMVVHLCSYLIERHKQAMDFILAPPSPLLSPLSSGLVLDKTDKEILSDLQKQVYRRLAHLQWTLRCT